MKIVAESHTDHVTQAHLDWIVEHFAGRDAFFIESVEMPEHLPTLGCDLHGPAMGDEPVRDDECRTIERPGRMTRGISWPSRVCDRAPRQTRVLTVIAGPHEGDACVLYTAFGGPKAEREPGDPDIRDDAERDRAAAFWAKHALSCPTKRVMVRLSHYVPQDATVCVDVPVDATDEEIVTTAWEESDDAEWYDDVHGEAVNLSATIEGLVGPDGCLEDE